MMKNTVDLEHMTASELEQRRLKLREELADAWIDRQPLEDIAVIEGQLRDVWRAMAKLGEIDDAETAADIDCACCCC